MKKQGLMLILATLMVLFLSGAVSAAENSSSTGGEVDSYIGVKVNYEYSDDVINPDISVKDSNNNSVNYNKTYDNAFNGYKLNIISPDIVNGTNFKVTVKAPGYITQTKNTALHQSGTDPNFYGNAEFAMKATENYKLGREVTAKADQLLNFKSADEVLCITTAGLTYRNGTTTEDCLEGVLNGSNGLITYGKGNLLTLRKTRVDPVDFGFVTKKGSNLKIAYFKNGSLNPVYVGTLSENMTLKQWNAVVEKFGDDAFPYASLANAWSIGLSSDILKGAAFHGHLCLGTVSGQAMIQTLLKYYPTTTEFGLPQEGVSYQVLGVPGDSDDDAFIYSMDTTPGKRAYVGYNTTTDSKMVGFIRWNSKLNTGTLIVMAFNEDLVVQQFKKETGLTAYQDIASELKFNKWMVKKLETNPESLIIIVKELEGLTEDQLHYLMGYEPGKGNTTIEAAGLDMEYINSLNLKKSTRSNMTYSIGNLTPKQLRQIGIDAANKAKELFQAIGIDLEKDQPNLMVLTSASYVRLNGQVTDMVMDGIYDVFGSRLSRLTLLPVHSAIWKNIVFDFSYSNGTEIITKSMYYDPATRQLIVDNNTNYNLQETLLYKPPYDALMGWLYHNHVCGGSVPGYLLVDYIHDQYPLGENEKYIYVTTSDNCKDDPLQYLLGISPGLGTYYNQRLTSEDTKYGDGSNVGFLIKWDEKNNIGTVAIINWVAPKFKPDSNSYEEYIRLYKGDYSSANLISNPLITSISKKYITSSELGIILAGGTSSQNSLNFIMGLPIRSLSDLLPKQDGSNNGQNGTSTETNTDGSNRPIGSIGETGSSVGTVQVSAATETGTSTGEGETGKAYEVSEKGTGTEDDTPYTTYAIVGVLSLLALAGIGFFFKGSMLGK